MTATDQNVSGAAGRYASALFELAGEARQTAVVGADLRAFQAMLDESADLSHLVRSPVFKAGAQLASIEALGVKAGLSELTLNFIRLAAKNRRLPLISQIIAGYSALEAQAKGETTAEVISAEPLSAAQVKDLKSALKASLGRDAMLTQRVDPSILGGLIVKAGSRMIDNSLKTKLNALKIAMKGTA